MGHQIEYLAELPEAAVRDWLSRLDGFDCSDPGDPTQDWEGTLQSGGTFWAEMAPEICLFSLAMQYSGLYGGWPPAIDFARRFESEFRKQFGPCPVVRLDEFLRVEWEQAVGCDWWLVERPVESLLGWLRSHPDYDDHWDLLGDTQQKWA